MGTALSTVSSLGVNTIVIEAPIIVIVVILLVILLVLNSRRKKGPKPAKDEAAAPEPQSYYADLQQPGAQPQAGVQPAAFGAAPAAPPGAPAGPASPPPGTAAGWLPDPAVPRTPSATGTAHAGPSTSPHRS